MCVKFDRTIHVTGPTPKDFGRYYIKDTFVTYIGHTEDGWWYWQFQLDNEDVNQPDEWFDMLMDNEAYYNDGFSCGYFETLNELNEDLEGLNI